MPCSRGDADEGAPAPACEGRRRGLRLTAAAACWLALPGGAWPAAGSDYGDKGATDARGAKAGKAGRAGKAGTAARAPLLQPVVAESVRPGGESDFLLSPPDGRALRIRVRWPDQPGRHPLVLWSPGLGSGLSGGQAWCGRWREEGCVVVTLSHPDTDDALWDAKTGTFQARMARALAAGQTAARAADCRRVLAACLGEGTLAAWIDPERTAVAGHSYGALTVQALAGQLGPEVAEPRLRAFIAVSPGATSRGSAQRMARVRAPFLGITGTHDGQLDFIEGASRTRLGVPLAQRLWIHEHLPVGRRHLVLIDQADHMSLAGEAVSADRYSRDVPVNDEANRAIWGVVAEVSTRFLQDAWRAPGGDAPGAPLASRLREALRPQDTLRD